MKTNIKINITPSFCNEWPLLRIWHNGKIVWDNEVNVEQVINIDVESVDSNQLSLEHYGKRFGENNVWDTTETEDRFIRIDDIRFDDVSIGVKLMTNMIFTRLPENEEMHTFGSMNFNGYLTLDYETPVYSWLTLAKYKEPMAESAFFSNHTTRWHYDEDLRIIQEIKDLLK